MTSQALNRPVDVLLNIRAVADVFAAQGAQRSADDLYATADAVAALIDAVDHWCALMPGLAGGPEFDRMKAALAAIGSQP